MCDLQHKVPCKRCPWKRGSLSGWLGGYTPEDFFQMNMYEVEMGCHCAADNTQEKFLGKVSDVELEEKIAAGPLCAGALIFMKNTCKVPRKADVRAAFDLVEKDTTTVFSNGMEFIEHHKKDPV